MRTHYHEELQHKFSERENGLIDWVKRGDTVALEKAGLNSHELRLLFFASIIEEKEEVLQFVLKKAPNLLSISIYLRGQDDLPIQAILRNKGIKNKFFNMIDFPNALTVAMCFNKQMTIAQFLLDQGISLKARSVHNLGYEALHMASALGRTDILEMILSRKEGLALINEFGKEAQKNTPLSVAIQYGQLESVKTLIKYGARLDEALDATKWDSCSEEVIYYLINETEAINKDEKAIELVIDAIKKGRCQVFKELINSEKFPDLINYRDEAGKTLLHYVVKDNYPNTPEILAARTEMEKLLLSKNPNLAHSEDNAHHKAAQDAKPGSEKRDLLRLHDVQKKYGRYKNESKHAGRIKLFGIRFRYSDKAKYMAVTHFIHDLVNPNEQKQVNKKDERILKHSPELKSLYKKFSKEKFAGAYQKIK